MATDPADIALFTVETVPVKEYLGAVRAWWRDPDFATAEAAAIAELAKQAAALGADAVVGVRVESTYELIIESPAKLSGPSARSSAVNRVYITGTAAIC
jgi:hypothetical protein